MPAQKRKFKTIDEYVRTFPKDVQGILQRLRQTVRQAAPQAVETMSYDMPTFKLDGKFLVSFAAWKSHIGLYPVPSGTVAFQKEVSAYRGAKSTVRFPLEKPIPHDLVKNLVLFRMKENYAKK